MHHLNRFNEPIINTNFDVQVLNDGINIGKSEKGIGIKGFRFGNGKINLSLIAGNHSDEPTGPRLLRKLVTWLSRLSDHDRVIRDYSWFIVPHSNPDGEEINRQWYEDDQEYYDLARNLKHGFREPPGRDLEFGYPDEEHGALRSENEAVYNFWCQRNAPFHLHISLHGMNRAFGAWYLIDEHWIDRTSQLRAQATSKTEAHGYLLHDVDRKGEKGFRRIAPGFCTRPDSKYMSAYFESINDPEMARKFHPSSMESIRSLGGDCLTLVSEMPLFILPWKSGDISWPNQEWDYWSQRFAGWKQDLLQGRKTESEVNQEAENAGVKPMSVKDQMMLQWNFFTAGVEAVEAQMK